MIIDSHAHLKHGDAAATEYTAEQIVELMDATGVDKAVVFAISCTASRSVEMAGDAAERFPDRLIPYVYACPSFEEPVIPVLRRAISDRGFKGIKVHRGVITLQDYMIDPVYALAGELDVPCVIDFCGDIGAARRAVTSFPQTQFIVAHIGRYLATKPAEFDPFIELAEEHDNVILDASGVILSWKIGDAARRVGADRIVFGTDGPHATPTLKAHVQREIERIRSLDLTDDDKDAILGGTIARVLTLSPA